MTIAQAFLPEFDVEMRSTRRLLERVPDGRNEWKPHAKSPTLAWLVEHVVELTSWVSIAVTQAELDVASPAGGAPRPTLPADRAELLRHFDVHCAAARAALATATDEHMLQSWSLKNAGAVLNHLIHHRGQLTVYLRLLDVPLPRLYGPSADEPM